VGTLEAETSHPLNLYPADIQQPGSGGSGGPEDFP
jgi:hypothetical protein